LTPPWAAGFTAHRVKRNGCAVKLTLPSFNSWSIFALEARKHRHELFSDMNDSLQEFKALSGVGVIVLGKLMADLTLRLVKPSYSEQFCFGQATCLEG
jgi:hypothetical protein